MDLEAFREIVNRARTKKPWLFELEHDSIPTVEDIIAFQKQHKIIFPEKFIWFISNFGGGYFGYANIYSLDRNSCFFIFNHNSSIVKDLLFVADNGCGDYYAFRIENNRCSEEIVFYDHETNVVQNTAFSDVLEYLVKIGLNQ
ncbi:MAG: SMI1/KNR4 family protein [Oscillospiraceae bacterium]|nr:SMI1/KNR4 family protein [Oscillospiraceae bacterium]